MSYPTIVAEATLDKPSTNNKDKIFFILKLLPFSCYLLESSPQQEGFHFGSIIY
jgi:hypothetical protein